MHFDIGNEHVWVYQHRLGVIVAASKTYKAIFRIASVQAMGLQCLFAYPIGRDIRRKECHAGNDIIIPSRITSLLSVCAYKYVSRLSLEIRQQLILQYAHECVPNRIYHSPNRKARVITIYRGNIYRFVHRMGRQITLEMTQSTHRLKVPKRTEECLRVWVHWFLKAVPTERRMVSSPQLALFDQTS